MNQDPSPLNTRVVIGSDGKLTAAPLTAKLHTPLEREELLEGGNTLLLFTNSRDGRYDGWGYELPSGLPSPEEQISDQAIGYLEQFVADVRSLVGDEEYQRAELKNGLAQKKGASGL